MTFSGGQPITVAISRWLRSPSSNSTSAPRWSSGRPREVGDQLAQVGAAADVVGEPVERRLELVDGDGGVAARGQQRAAAVAGDREQPRPHRVGHAAGAQRAVGAQEGLLERVLAVLAVADHVAAEREQRRVVAVVERLEGALVAASHERRQTLVVECFPKNFNAPVTPARRRIFHLANIRRTRRVFPLTSPTARTLAVAALAVAALLALPRAAPAQACDTQGEAGTGYAAGVNCRTVELDGIDRHYLVYVPRDRPARAPVVFMFHGSSGTASSS